MIRALRSNPKSIGVAIIIAVAGIVFGNYGYAKASGKCMDLQFICKKYDAPRQTPFGMADGTILITGSGTDYKVTEVDAYSSGSKGMIHIFFSSGDYRRKGEHITSGLVLPPPGGSTFCELRTSGFMGQVFFTKIYVNLQISTDYKILKIHEYEDKVAVMIFVVKK